MADSAESSETWWERGAFAPVHTEEHLDDLVVEGALPPSLNGVYMRNGANAPNGKSAHWFLGDGMLHGVRLEGGRARWYRNRYVKTVAHLDPKDPLDFVSMMDKTRSSANTSVVRHAGRIFALEEGHFPYEVSADLETKGFVDFDGKLTTGFTAHPKLCPESGEMLAIGYQAMPPFMTYHRFDAAGRLLQSVDIPVQGPMMAHDFAASRRHAIFMDLPVLFSLEDAMAGRMPYAWNETYQARFGVMPRDGSVNELRWFNIAPCYIFHVLNAYDEGDEVVLDAARYARMWSKAGAFEDGPAQLWRYRLNLKTGAVRETQLDDARIEFPRLDERLVGLKNRFGYAVETAVSSNDTIAMDGLVSARLFKYDLETGSRQDAHFGERVMLGEPVFASAGAGEDEGYVMTYALAADRQSTDLVVLDAQNFSRGPIARVKIPRRIPIGFHGSFFPDE
ncbi:MAG: carotenoid oxygenase family protein [Caulobacterales bacterium]